MSLVLFVEKPEVDVAETLFVVGQFRHREAAPEREAVGCQVQGDVRPQHTVYGRGRGEQPQGRTDVQSGDVEPDIVGRSVARSRMERDPLVAVGEVEIGFQAFVEPVDEVVAGIDAPRFESEQGI